MPLSKYQSMNESRDFLKVVSGQKDGGIAQERKKSVSEPVRVKKSGLQMSGNKKKLEEKIFNCNTCGKIIWTKK